MRTLLAVPLRRWIAMALRRRERLTASLQSAFQSSTDSVHASHGR